ncbi:MAG: hypothetical protein AB1427_08730 [Thermodesulfobacteriota bacterium]
MKRGYIKTWRKSLDSAVFGHDGMWKLFCLCLMKACHKAMEVTIPGTLKPIRLEPGQFVTGRYSLHEDYHQAHLKKRYSRKAAPTAITLYRWLLILQDMQILNINSYNKYSIITVINWHLYQSDEQQMNNRRTSDEHKQECIKNEKETLEKISLLKNRYSDQALIEKCFDAIRSTRKAGRVSDSVLLTQLRAWERYPVDQVEASIKIYLDKDYAGQGKDEKYLMGVIRHFKPGNEQPTTGPQLREITAGNLGELYEN